MDVAAGPAEMNMLASAADGMAVQRSLLDLAARNVAAAQAGTPDHPYSRLVAQVGNVASPATDSDDDSDSEFDGETSLSTAGIVGVRSEPGSGDALGEMIAVLDAQRSYEQNASVFDTAKRLAERTIDIGRS